MLLGQRTSLRESRPLTWACGQFLWPRDKENSYGKGWSLVEGLLGLHLASYGAGSWPVRDRMVNRMAHASGCRGAWPILEILP